MSKDVQVTKEGFDKLKAELEDLQGRVRLEVADAIREAKSHGDLRENAAYHEAKLNQTRLESRISELEKAIRSAKIVERVESGEGGIQLGSVVELIDLEFGDTVTVTLVGSFEADPAMDKVSIGSPLGEALMGRSEGETIEVKAPAGVSSYTIKSLKV
jgi:transcription elongation factor GreA